jgi:2,3-dihydroxybiphenyl 1,2-dioxygenase
MSLRLAYVGIDARQPERWRDFSELLGLQPVETASALFLRMDAKARRFIITEGSADDLAFCGFEAERADDFRSAVERLRTAGIAFEEGTAAGAELRGVERYVSFCDPAGIRHEIASACAVAQAPFTPKFPHQGFVTGSEGMGHIAVISPDYAQCRDFFSKATGAGLSDHIFSAFGDSTVRVAFMHLNPRHHSVAYAQFPVDMPRKIDHIMIEAVDLVDVLKAQARVAEANIPITITLGEHPNDHAVSFYCTTPCGFRIEVAANCVKVTPGDWKPVAYDYFSMWGHRVLA